MGTYDCNERKENSVRQKTVDIGISMRDLLLANAFLDSRILISFEMPSYLDHSWGAIRRILRLILPQTWQIHSRATERTP